MSIRKNTRKLVRAALIAAIYVALCLVLLPLSFGPVQVRASEALTVLVVLCPEAVAGVTLGCFIANMIGSAPIDMVVGTTATLLAALVSYKLRNVRFGRARLALAASIPPVLFNAVIIGVMLTLLEAPGAGIPLYLANMASVGAGQLVSCTVLGVALVWALEKNPALCAMLFGKQPDAS